MKLEELLNKLITLGWKPRGLDINESYEPNIGIINEGVRVGHNWFSLNDLCSIDSGFWQFVCEKGFTNGNYPNNISSDIGIYIGDYEYRIMLSSIQPDKEKFLLENIKID